jgi:hypothetical protein
MENLTLEEQRLLQSELSQSEKVLWTGKPNPRAIFHPSDRIAIPFSLLWGGFAIFWEMGVSGIGPFGQKGQWGFGTLWGIPFVLIGQYSIWGRFFYAAWKKNRIVYALTTQRLIMLVRPPQQKMLSRYLENVLGIDKEIRPDGIGTLKFGETPPVWSSGRQAKTASMEGLYLNSSTPVFVDIDDAAAVASQIDRERRRQLESMSAS